MKLLVLLYILTQPAYTWYPQEQYRRQWHIGISLTLSTAVFYTSKGRTYKRLTYANLTAFGVGLGKEVYDYNTGGKFDLNDIRDNLLGIFVSDILFVFLHKRVDK